MDNKRKRILLLFLSFLKIGAFTFGGGYAMIPMISREIVEKRKWITDDDILEIIAISESTPGPFAVNSATFVGYRVAGFWGAFFSTLGVVFPSFCIITVLSFVLTRFRNLKAVRYAFFGIRAGVLSLLIKALVNMYKKCPKGIFAYILMGAAFVVATFVHINAIYIILGCAILGLVRSFAAERRMHR